MWNTTCGGSGWLVSPRTTLHSHTLPRRRVEYDTCGAVQGSSLTPYYFALRTPVPCGTRQTGSGISRHALAPNPAAGFHRHPPPPFHFQIPPPSGGTTRPIRVHYELPCLWDNDGGGFPIPPLPPPSIMLTDTFHALSLSGIRRMHTRSNERMHAPKDVAGFHVYRRVPLASRHHPERERHAGQQEDSQKVSHPHGNGRGRFFTSFSPVHHAYGHLPRLKLKWNTTHAYEVE